jgi:preprotein translocase subunit SecB
MSCQINSIQVVVDSYYFKKNVVTPQKSYEIAPNVQREIGLENLDKCIDDSRKAFVRFKVTVTSTDEKPTPFDLEAVVTGFFTMNKDANEKEANTFLKVNASRMVFPYLRSLVSSLTASAMIPSLQLPLAFFDEETEETEKDKKAK